MSALAVYTPLLPEAILAIGAMVLLMLGVFRHWGWTFGATAGRAARGGTVAA